MDRDKSPDDHEQREAAARARSLERHRQRTRVLVGQERLVRRVEMLLSTHDPIDLNFGSNEHEYRGEAEAITLRLPEATNRGDVLRIVHEEFVHWFGACLAGLPERYTAIADEIWGEWLAFTATRSTAEYPTE